MHKLRSLTSARNPTFLNISIAFGRTCKIFKQNCGIYMMQTPESKSYISVPDFYAGKSIFVTGGSGFLGKILVEKLLWSCPEIDKIYFHIRPTKNEIPASRLSTLLHTPVFDRLRQTRPQDLEKIIPVSGDLCEPCLGISQSDQEKLLRDVSIVFHSAATVRFNEPIRQAVFINVAATKTLVDLCHQMPKLQAFVHISTAYCNCNRHEVKEEIYDVPFDPNKIIQLMEMIDDDIAAACSPILIGNRVNTYVFTKALAEKILEKDCNKLPLVIVRPSIVLSSKKEPIPGWLETWVGPTSYIIAGAKGLLHTLPGDGSKVADIVPADIVVNLIICSAWHISTTTQEQKIQIYNCGSGYRNPIKCGQFFKCCNAEMRKNPLKGIINFPHLSLQPNPIIYNIKKVLADDFPVHMVHFINFLSVGNVSVLRNYKKLIKYINTTQYFLRNDWQFLDDNVKSLNNSLRDDDRQIFPFDVCDIHWPSYLEDYCFGIRNFLLKESPDSKAACRKRYKM